MKVTLQLAIDALAAPGAVGSFNVIDFDLARAVVDASERTGRPVVIGIAARHWTAIDARHLVPAIRSLIESAGTPIALHLDHAKPADGAIVREALDLGFSSIMIDGSALPLAGNIEVTAETVRLARRYAASVEAELGTVTGEEGVADQKGEEAAERAAYTDPHAVPHFLSETEADALAVSVGTAHGLYRQAPRIRFDLITTIAERVSTPLVLHGATGVPDDHIRKAVRNGIRKINFFSGFLVDAKSVISVENAAGGHDYLSFRRRMFEAWERTAERNIRLYSLLD